LIQQWCVEVQNNVKRGIYLSSAVLAAITASATLGVTPLTCAVAFGTEVNHSSVAAVPPEAMGLSAHETSPTVQGPRIENELEDSRISNLPLGQEHSFPVQSPKPTDAQHELHQPVIAFGEPLSPQPSATASASTQPEPSEVIAPAVFPSLEVAQESSDPSSRETDTSPLEELQESPPNPDIPTTPTPGGPSIPTTPPANELRVLISEIQIEGVEGRPEAEQLREAVYNAISVKAGEPTTRSELQNDLNAIFATGFFSNVRFLPQDTPLGVQVTFIVEPNPTFTAVETEGTKVLPPDLVQETFQDQYGKILNLQNLQDGVKKINQWYQDNGYALAQVVDASQISPDGKVKLVIAEGEIANIDVHFLSETGEETDEEGNVIKGRTKPYIITREFSLKPGDIFNRNQAEKDIQRVFGLGLFEDVRLALNPSPDDPRKVVVIANVIEGNSGSIGAGAGLSSDTGLFGSISYQQQNLRGRNYIVGTELTLGESALLFDASFTNPWIKGDPYRTSYTVDAFRRRSISLVYDGGDRDVDLPNGDTPRIVRTGGGIRFTRPLSRDVYNPSVWTASLGLQYQHVTIQDEDGDKSPYDQFGNALTLSGDNSDDLITLGFGLSRDLRNNRAQPTGGSLARVNVDQSLPFGSGSILMNRIRANYSYYIPMRLIRFKEGCRKEDPSPADCPQTLAFNVQGGTVFGDLPPYESFLLGGSNSIRGYKEGSVASGRSFVQATAEYRFPLFSVIGGALFADVGTDLGTGSDVPGKPAVIRDKPGSGFGVGLGVRVRSPIGAIRVDYGLNDQGDTRFHFGIGERF
jgi:outer membrane protein insertion porin family